MRETTSMVLAHVELRQDQDQAGPAPQTADGGQSATHALAPAGPAKNTNIATGAMATDADGCSGAPILESSRCGAYFTSKQKAVPAA